jgi:hypothetical protein
MTGDLELPELHPVRVAISVPGTIADLAWGQSLYDRRFTPIACQKKP